MQRLNVLLLLLLGAIWGSSFLFIRLAVSALGPTVLMEARVGLAAGVLAVVVAASRHWVAWRSRWWQWLVLGTLNAALPFTLIALAELHLTASWAAILNATTPLLTALVAAIWLKEALTRTILGGICLGMSGVALLVGWSPQPLIGPTLLAVGASLVAALCYGIGGVYAKRAFGGVSPLHLALGQQAAAAVVLFPVAVTQLPPTWPEPRVMLAVTALAVVCTALAYLVYFRLLTQVGPTRTLLVTFLVPVFGVIWAALFLHEPVTVSEITGMGIILVSLGLVTKVWFLAWSASHSLPVQGQQH